MERETRIAEKLRRVNFDLTRLTENQRIEIYDLALWARIEIWPPGQRWPSSPGTTDGALTRIAPGRP